MTESVKDRDRVLQGTWDEIAPHAPEFEGRQLTLIVRTEEQPDEPKPRNLAEALAPFLEEAKNLKRETPIPSTDPYEIAFGEIMEEKRRQGRL